MKNDDVIFNGEKAGNASYKNGRNPKEGSVQKQNAPDPRGRNGQQIDFDNQ